VHFITFYRDIQRFRQEGLLVALLYLLFARLELLLTYGLFIALYFYYRADPRSVMLVCVGAAAVTLLIFVEYTVQVLTPTYFGPFAIGCLTNIQWSKAGVAYRFELVPSGLEITLSPWAFSRPPAAPGRRYLLLQHPAVASILLPLFDDYPRALTPILRLARSERRDLILRQLDFFRGRSAHDEHGGQAPHGDICPQVGSPDI
jgi:hypothetical protein